MVLVPAVPAAGNVGTVASDEPTPVCGPAPVPGCEAWRSGTHGYNVRAVDPGPSGALLALAGQDTVERIHDFATTGGSTTLESYVQVVNAQTGAPIWSSTLDYDEAELLRDVQVGPDGDVVVAVGGVGGGFDTEQLLTVAFEATTGEPLWSDVIGPEDTREGFAREVAFGPGGDRVYVAGYIEGQDNDYLVAYNASTGERAWTETEPGYSAYHQPRVPNLEVAPDGETVYLAGRGSPSGCECQHLALAVDASSGDRLWTFAKGGFDTYEAAPFEVALSPGGGELYLGTESFSDIRIIAVDTGDGTQAWDERLWTFEGNQYMRGLEAGPDGDLYVGARTFDGFLTIAAGATGDLPVRWSDLYENGDDLEDLALGPQGARVYVSGDAAAPNLPGPDTAAPDLDDDYLTLAYRADDGEHLWAARKGGLPRPLLISPGHTGWDVEASPLGSKVFVGGLSGHPLGAVAYHALPAPADAATDQLPD